MSDNKETISALYRAFASGDIPTVLGMFDANIHWTEAEGFPYGGKYTGPEEVLENVFMKLGGEWDGFAAECHEIVADGDAVVALGDYSGTYRATGKSMRAPFAHVFHFSDGKVVRFHQHTDTVIVRRALDGDA